MREIQIQEQLADGISIVMPIYNSSSYLDAAIKSVLQQSYPFFELLLIDDGSKDDSLEICKRYAEIDERIRVYHIENRGVSGARNYGMELAEGKYIYFMDADDVLKEGALEALHLGMSKEECDLVIGRFQCERGYFQSELSGLQSQKSLICDFVRYLSSFYYGVPWNKLYKRELIERQKLRFKLDLSWCEDCLFNIEYFKMCRNVFYLEEEVYKYIVRENSLATISARMSRNERMQIDMLRFQEARSLINQYDNLQEEEQFAFDFIVRCIHTTLCDICNLQKITREERYAAFLEILSREDVKQLLKEYQNVHHYRTLRYLKRLSNAKEYKKLYLFYRTKERIKRSRLWNWISQYVLFSPDFKL